MKSQKNGFMLLANSVFAGWLFLCFASSASPQVPFYEGKTITIIQGRSPGGVGDIRVRAVVNYLAKYIPGNPTIVLQYMPGGGGRKAANYLFNAARADGLTIGNTPSAVVAHAVLGAVGVKYNLDKLIYLGTTSSAANHVFLTGKDAGLNSLDKLRSGLSVRFGAQSVGHDIYIRGRLFAYMIGMKEPRFITGYSSHEIDLAMMRGEVDAQVTVIDNLLRQNPDWIQKGLVDLHAVMDTPKGNKHPHTLFAQLPEIDSFTKSANERKLLAMYRAFRIGPPFIIPPGTPRKNGEILQVAMRKAFKDPEFREEFKKITGEEPTPLLPETMEKAIKDLPRDAELVGLFKKIAGGEPLPPR